MAALKGSSQDDLVDKNGKSLTGRARERAARERSTEVLKLAGRDGVAWGDEYGAGKLTKDQEKSQKRHIPMTERDNSRGARAARALWG